MASIITHAFFQNLTIAPFVLGVGEWFPSTMESELQCNDNPFWWGKEKKKKLSLLLKLVPLNRGAREVCDWQCSEFPEMLRRKIMQPANTWGSVLQLIVPAFHLCITHWFLQVLICMVYNHKNHEEKWGDRELSFLKQIFNYVYTLEKYAYFFPGCIFWMEAWHLGLLYPTSM